MNGDIIIKTGQAYTQNFEGIEKTFYYKIGSINEESGNLTYEGLYNQFSALEKISVVKDWIKKGDWVPFKNK